MAKIITDNVAYARTIRLMGTSPRSMSFPFFDFFSSQASEQMPHRPTLLQFYQKISRPSSRPLLKFLWVPKFQTLISPTSTPYATKSSLSPNTEHNLLNTCGTVWVPLHPIWQLSLESLSVPVLSATLVACSILPNIPPVLSRFSELKKLCSALWRRSTTHRNTVLFIMWVWCVL